MISQTQLLELLRAIYQEPADLHRRAILGDYLEEEGDPRAHLVRLSVNLLSVPRGGNAYISGYWERLPDHPQKKQGWHIKPSKKQKVAGFRLARLLAVLFFERFVAQTQVLVYPTGRNETTVLWARYCFFVDGVFPNLPSVQSISPRWSKKPDSVIDEIVDKYVMTINVTKLGKDLHWTNPEESYIFLQTCRKMYEVFKQNIPWSALDEIHDTLYEQDRARHEKRMPTKYLPRFAPELIMGEQK